MQTEPLLLCVGPCIIGGQHASQRVHALQRWQGTSLLEPGRKPARRWLRDLAPGLTPRSVLEKFAAVQMIDVHLPATDGRHVILPRYTQPEHELQALLNQLKLFDSKVPGHAMRIVPRFGSGNREN